MKSPMVCEPLTMPMCAPTADGSAAAIVCSEEFMISRGLQVNGDTKSFKCKDLSFQRVV